LPQAQHKPTLHSRVVISYLKSIQTMKNIIKLKLGLIIFIVPVIYSCSTSFHLQTDNHIETLNLSVEFNENIDSVDQAILSHGILNAISIWNLEKHEFRLKHCKVGDLNEDQLTLKIDSIVLPPSFIKGNAIVLNTGIVTGAVYYAAQTTSPFAAILPLVSVKLNNVTNVEYSLSEDMTTKPEMQKDNFITPINLFGKKEVDRRKHIRNFDNQLLGFLEKLEKQYKKNSL
jgi:hypothetical protein